MDAEDPGLGGGGREAHLALFRDTLERRQRLERSSFLALVAIFLLTVGYVGIYAATVFFETARDPFPVQLAALTTLVLGLFAALHHHIAVQSRRASEAIYALLSDQ